MVLDLFICRIETGAYKVNLMNLGDVAMATKEPDVSNQHAFIEHHILYFIYTSLRGCICVCLEICTNVGKAEVSSNLSENDGEGLVNCTEMHKD